MNIQCHFRTSRSAPQCCLSAVSSALQQQLFLLNGTFLAQWQPAVLTALAPGPTEGANLVAACSLPVALLRTAGRCQWPCELVLGGQLRHLSLCHCLSIQPVSFSFFLVLHFSSPYTHPQRGSFIFSYVQIYLLLYPNSTGNNVIFLITTFLWSLLEKKQANYRDSRRELLSLLLLCVPSYISICDHFHSL